MFGTNDPQEAKINFISGVIIGGLAVALIIVGFRHYDVVPDVWEYQGCRTIQELFCSRLGSM